MIDERILKLCMRVNGLTAYFPQYNKVDSTPIEPKPEMIGKYGWNNGVVAFVTANGDYYVTPYCVEVADYLSSNGYENNYIYVPFSNLDEPSDGVQAQAWKKLCMEAKELHNQKEKERKREQVKIMATSKHVSQLPLEIYEMSLEIPNDGLVVKHYGGETTIVRPVPEFSLREDIGTYNDNNSIIVFVDNNGKTFISPYHHEVLEILKNNKYQHSKIYVPLSNGEEIVDNTTNDQWKKLCLGSREMTLSRIAESRKQKYIEIAEIRNIGALPDDVYRLSFEIPENGIDTIWFGEKHETTMPLNEWELEHAIGTYCQNNDRLVFVNEKGKTYVTPFASEITATLRKSGYKGRNMYVPFSNGDIPSNEIAALKWKQLCSIARKEYELREEKRKIEKLQKLAEEKNIIKLPDRIYELSLKIPKEGFETTFMDSERDHTRPVQDWELEHALGTYCENNGRIVFVDDKGDTYVSPYCIEISAVLINSGYTPYSLFVPLSNGEKIANEEIAQKWYKLCSRIDDK